MIPRHLNSTYSKREERKEEGKGGKTACLLILTVSLLLAS
jgi:hypothetical protein